MDVKTKTMGTVQVEEKNLVDFPAGLFGFEEFHKFAIIEAEYEPFLWLQSLDESGLAFIMVDPFAIEPEYELDVDDKTLAEIGVKSPADVVVFAIVTVPANGKPVTANLQGPLVINRKNGKALQVVLNDTKWTTKEPLLKKSKESK